jgi:hypothetical protein
MIQRALTNMSILKFSQTLEQHIQDEIDEAYQQIGTKIILQEGSLSL